jgi:hypothetical protein
MKPTAQIVMSAASVAAALQVIGGMAAEQKTLSVTSTESFGTQARTAVSSAQSQAMIRSSMAVIANTVKIDDRLMGEKYAQLEGASATKAANFLVRLKEASGAPYDVATSKYMQDSVDNPMALTCYSNCHNACHGSRGWR